jgi:Tfp pilus assembly protein PilN
MNLQQINLLNPQLLTPQVAFSSKTIAWTLLGVLVMGLVIYAWVESNSGSIQTQYNQAQTMRDELQAKIDAQSQPTEDGLTPEDKRAQVVTVEKKRIAQLKQLQMALGAVQGGTGFSSRLHALANEGVSGVWLTEIEFGRDGFRLQGRALQPGRIPEYMAVLSRQPALKDLALNHFSILTPETEAEDKAPEPGVAFLVNPAREGS